MDEYREIVDSCFDKDSPDLIYNSSKNHAKYLIEKLFKRAEKNIKLYTSGEDITFYEENNVDKIINDNPEIKMDIIIDQDCAKEKYKALFPRAGIFCIEKGKEDFTIQLSDKMSDPDYSVIKHFITIDEKAFRVEKPHDSQSDQVEAVGCAYDEKLTKAINSLFNILISDKFALPAFPA